MIGVLDEYGPGGFSPARAKSAVIDATAIEGEI